ncbi:MAG: hypothetical protein KGY99_05135 [Phycisphaerae bacterium]|nr:hypothetical protein [Phycisphaerae bacterium]
MVPRIVAVCLIVVASIARAEPPEEQSIGIVFVNGDHVQAKLHEIRDGRMQFSLAMAPEQRLQADVKQVERLTTAGDSEPPKKRARLSLQTGTELYGVLKGFRDGAMSFEADGLGVVRAPLEMISAYERSSDVPLPDSVDLSKQTVVTQSGDALVGRLAPSGEAAIEVRGDATLTVSIDEIAAVYSPSSVPTTRPATRDAGRYAVVRTSNGQILAGRDLAIADKALSLDLSKVGSVSVPLARLCEVQWMPGPMTMGRGHLRRVLVWGSWADRDEELKRTIAALKATLPGWTIEKDVSKDFTGAFEQRLSRCRALVIAEQEQWGGAERVELGRQLKPIVRRFLYGGGNVVLLGMQQRERRFCVAANLLDYKKVASGDGVETHFTEAGARLARKVGESFSSTNSTMRYHVGDEIEAQQWAVPADQKSAAIIGRRVGRGWVILMGMDFYAANDRTRQILANAAALR